MKSRKISAILILIGGLAMFYGLQRGEATAVMTKAIRICLECIGIGL
ncbi:MAG: CD1871A family CXXC motif-containing protein [Syntrophomonadaceae bacterium]|nr:CD1871A family CXXC motif-containing protein [Syntrophomonadaceae bacterium]MDD4550370.1 CD1871A family CXXC motif-containing protein [Syntrophomonadaceae bacterium]